MTDQMVLTLSSELQAAADKIASLRYELDEANAEIARHHRDFDRIRTEIAAVEGRRPDYYGHLGQFVRRLRSIVG